jgi:hypothetical protein
MSTYLSLFELEAIEPFNAYLPLYLLSLANHGFLPRDGRNITVDHILQAGVSKSIQLLVLFLNIGHTHYRCLFTQLLHCHLDGYNIQPEVLIFFAKLGLMAGPGSDTFSLENIRLYVLLVVSTIYRLFPLVLPNFS